MLWLLGLCMAAGAMTGGWLGSHSAIKFGARLIRPLLVVISLGLTGAPAVGLFRGLRPMSALRGKRTLQTLINLPDDHGDDEKAQERGDTAA